MYLSVVTYDKANRRIAASDGSGAASKLEYDAAGNLEKATSPDGYTIYFDYDAANRVTTAYDQEGNSVERTLDPIGNKVPIASPCILLYSYHMKEFAEDTQ